MGEGLGVSRHPQELESSSRYWGARKEPNDRLPGPRRSVPAFLIPGLLHTFSKTTAELQSTSFYQGIYY